MSDALIEITGLTNQSGPLTKRISLGADGTLISDGSACVMGRGSARRMRFDAISDFAKMIGNLDATQAIALGALRADLPDFVEVTTARRLQDLNGSAPTNLISRTAGHINYVPRRPALALLDFDTKAMPHGVATNLEALGGFWNALLSVCPGLERAATVVRRSTSSGIVRSDTGQAIKGSDGQHIFVLVQDGGDVERFLKTLSDRCWLRGLGWMMVGAGGQFLERSIVDRTVCAAERLVFEGAPVLERPLVQDPHLREPIATDGQPVDTWTVCQALSVVELATLRDLKGAERHRLAPRAAEVRAAFVHEQSVRIAARTGAPLSSAKRLVERQCAGTLLPAVLLAFDSDDLAGACVGDVLANPDRFVGATLADPLEGIAYGPCKAKIMRRADGSIWIHSFAHGRTIYELRHDAGSVEAAILAEPPEQAADTLVQLLGVADLAPDEEQRLRELASARARVKARPLAAKIKAARADQEQQRARADRDRAAAARSDRRLQLPVPAPDAERLPVLRALDDVLCAVDETEPPMRDLDGHPVEVRSRPPMDMHELTSHGANQAELEKRGFRHQQCRC